MAFPKWEGLMLVVAWYVVMIPRYVYIDVFIHSNITIHKLHNYTYNIHITILYIIYIIIIVFCLVEGKRSLCFWIPFMGPNQSKHVYLATGSRSTFITSFQNVFSCRYSRNLTFVLNHVSKRSHCIHVVNFLVGGAFALDVLT